VFVHMCLSNMCLSTCVCPTCVCPHVFVQHVCVGGTVDRCRLHLWTFSNFESVQWLQDAAYVHQLHTHVHTKIIYTHNNNKYQYIADMLFAMARQLHKVAVKLNSLVLINCHTVTGQRSRSIPVVHGSEWKVFSIGIPSKGGEVVKQFEVQIASTGNVTPALGNLWSVTASNVRLQVQDVGHVPLEDTDSTVMAGTLRVILLSLVKSNRQATGIQCYALVDGTGECLKIDKPDMFQNGDVSKWMFQNGWLAGWLLMFLNVTLRDRVV